MSPPCPRCSTAEEAVALAVGAGALGEAVCARCGGRLLDEAAVERVIIEEHGVARETLREMAGHFGRPKLSCPGCGQRMHPIRLRALALDLCTGCGAVWLDAGELTQLSEGRWQEVAGGGAASPPVAPSTSTGYRTVLLEDDQADAELLVAAFKRAAFRTAQDARFAAQRGHGVLAERIPLEEAQGLVGALAVEGLSAQLVEPAALELPRAVRSKTLLVTDASITLADSLDRPIPLPWESVRVIGVGMVRFTESETKEDPTQPSEHAQSEGPARLLKVVRTVLVERDDVLLELVVVDPAGVRWRFRATRDSMVFRERAGQSVDAAFRAVVKHLIALAPRSALLSRGALTLSDARAPWLRYRALRDFEQAMRWTLARAINLAEGPA